MELFTVSMVGASEGETEDLYKKMGGMLNPLHNDQIQLESIHYGDISEIQCNAMLPDFDLVKDAPALLEKASESMAAFVMEAHEMKLIRQMIEYELEYCNEEEIKTIAQHCLHLLNDAGEERQSQHTQSARQYKMAKNLFHYLEENTRINLDGFLRFRMKEYMDELRETVEFAIDEFIMDKQYQEFISLLKYFVYLQDAKVPAVHLIHKENYDFVLLDEQFQPIEPRSMEGFVVEMLDQDMNYEDMIVSTLITVSPQNIFIHTREEEMQVIKTIEQIFENRTAICTYCPACQSILDEFQIKNSITHQFHT